MSSECEKERKLCEWAQALGTACISDAMDSLGIAGGLLGIRPIVSDGAFCAPAFTVRYGACGVPVGTVGDYLDEVPSGGIVVLDNRGRLDCTVWGSILSLGAKLRGLSATLIDGVCRDVEGLLDAGHPIYARATYMVTGKGRVQVEAVQQPVDICGICVRPGDFILGDLAGALRIPHEQLAAVVEAGERIEKAERSIADAIRNGMSVREARRLHRYHDLQARR